jgi:hypothetical protein
LPEIDIAAVRRIAGVNHMTLNGWFARDLVPGIAPVDQGKGRLFDLDTTLFIATMAQLTATGIDVSFARTCANACARMEGAYERVGSKLIIGPRTANGPVGSRTIDIIDTPSLESLDRYLDRFTDGRPLTYLIIELDKLGERVREAFAAEAAAREQGFTSGFRRVERGQETGQ